jgi:hypothetical protein
MLFVSALLTKFPAASWCCLVPELRLRGSVGVFTTCYRLGYRAPLLLSLSLPDHLFTSLYLYLSLLHQSFLLAVVPSSFFSLVSYIFIYKNLIQDYLMNIFNMHHSTYVRIALNKRREYNKIRIRIVKE